MGIHVHLDLRKMFTTLVWNDQHSFYLHYFHIIIFCVCQISIHCFIIEIQYNHVSILWYLTIHYSTYKIWLLPCPWNSASPSLIFVICCCCCCTLLLPTNNCHLHSSGNAGWTCGKSTFYMNLLCTNHILILRSSSIHFRQYNLIVLILVTIPLP